MKSRIKWALFFIGICVAINALLACLLAWISSGSRPFAEAFRLLFMYCFLLFGGSSVVSAFLLIATNIPESKAYPYGNGFYYGTLVCTAFLTGFMNMEDGELALIVSAVIAGLVCYIFWLKNSAEK